MIDADLSDRFRLFSGRASPELAWEVADLLGRDLCEVRFQTFHEGEFHIQIEQSVRGVDAYVIQPTCQPVNDNLMELLVLIDALRRASAASITAVVPEAIESSLQLAGQVLQAAGTPADAAGQLIDQLRAMEYAEMAPAAEDAPKRP